MCLEEPGLRLGDDTVKIILNTKGTMDDVGEDVKELLHYIAGQEPKSELTRFLDEEFIRDVIELLEKHPTMDDEEIAEIVMDW